MSLSIRTNVSSLNAQRNLSSTQGALDSSLSRLSSGFRITKAGDDAAGLGISTKLESQIRSYNQATRNANDGISVVQSTEAALNEQANILTRMRELAMQSASDGVGNVERGYIDQESTKLLAELQRISQVAEYNGTKLLDGSAATLDFQVGIAATANDVISLNSLNATTAGPTSVSAPNASQFQSAAFGAAVTELVTSGSRLGISAAVQTAAQAAGASAGQASQLGSLAVNLVGAYYATHGAYGAFATSIMPAGPVQTGAVQLLNAAATGGGGGDPVMTAAYQGFITAYNSNGGDTAGATTAAADAAESTALGLGVPVFEATQLRVFAGQAALQTFSVASSAAGGGAAGAAAGLAQLAGPVPASAGGAASGGGLAVSGLSLASKSGALAALASIDSALGTISSNRATLGAAGNRFQSAIANIQSFSESLSAANSRIKDVDVAEETSRMSRSQILMQAGVSVLAQANQMPQMALKLLG